MEFPLVSKVVDSRFMFLTVANSVQEAIQQLQGLFSQGDFLFRKWNSSEPSALQHVSPDLSDCQPIQMLPA